MRLLEYEAIETQEGSYNDMIKQLVKKMRYYYSEVSSDEFIAVVPELRSLEAKILRIDNDLGEDERDYIEDIMNELQEQAAIETVLIEEFKRTATVLFSKLVGQDFREDEFSFDYDIMKGISVLEYFGYKEPKEIDAAAGIVRDILRSLCSKYKVVFIDSSDKLS